MTPEPEGPFEYVPEPLADGVYSDGELIGYGWLPVWLDVIRTLALIVIAVAVCVR